MRYFGRLPNFKMLYLPNCFANSVQPIGLDCWNTVFFIPDSFNMCLLVICRLFACKCWKGVKFWPFMAIFGSFFGCWFETYFFKHPKLSNPGFWVPFSVDFRGSSNPGATLGHQRWRHTFQDCIFVDLDCKSASCENPKISCGVVSWLFQLPKMCFGRVFLWTYV